MLVDAGYASHIFSSHDNRPTDILVRDEAVDVHDAILHPDVEAEWCPFVMPEHSDDAAADQRITRPDIGDIVHEIGDGFDEILPADDTHELVALHHRHALDVILLHHVDDIGQTGLLGHRADLAGHDLVHLAAGFADIIDSLQAGATHEFEPARTPALRADLVPTQEVPLGHNADQLAGRIHHRQSADVIIDHQPRSFANRRVRRHGDELAGHNLMGSHDTLPLG